MLLPKTGRSDSLHMNTNQYDVIIIGGGAAGLSAALVLSRARRRVVVVDSGSPRNAPAAHMQGFLSRDGMPPSELLATGRTEVMAYGGQIVSATVEQLLGAGGTGAPAFIARLADGTPLHARRVLVTTGLLDELPDIPGLRDRWARDVLHCPYCHGYEVRDQRLGVVWNGPATPTYAQIVRQWSRDVVLLAPPATLTDEQRTELLARAIGIIESPVTGVEVSGDRLTGVTLVDGTTLQRDALFVPPRLTPRSDLLVQLGCDLDDDGWVVTGANGGTSVPGVRVAGNVSNPRAQVITAAGEGSAAAIALNADLVEEEVRLAVRDLDAHV
jgi:thioredoxin reductase